MSVADSTGWIEYLQDTDRVDLFAEAIEDRHALLVPTIALFEVHKVLSRSLPASQVAAQHKLAMADAAMYSMAQEFGAIFWTHDVDYRVLDRPDLDKQA